MLMSKTFFPFSLWHFQTFRTLRDTAMYFTYKTSGETREKFVRSNVLKVPFMPFSKLSVHSNSVFLL